MQAGLPLEKNVLNSAATLREEGNTTTQCDLHSHGKFHSHETKSPLSFSRGARSGLSTMCSIVRSVICLTLSLYPTNTVQMCPEIAGGNDTVRSTKSSRQETKFCCRLPVTIYDPTSKYYLPGLRLNNDRG